MNIFDFDFDCKLIFNWDVSSEITFDNHFSLFELTRAFFLKIIFSMLRNDDNKLTVSTYHSRVNSFCWLCFSCYPFQWENHVFSAPICKLKYPLNSLYLNFWLLQGEFCSLNSSIPSWNWAKQTDRDKKKFYSINHQSESKIFTKR